LSEAEAELLEVRRIWPSHPRTSLVERRLQVARQPAKPAADPPEDLDGAPADEELAAVLKVVPRGTMEAFTANVQPILQRHCANAGCHGPGTTSAFRLERLPSGQPITEKFSQRNLSAVLGTISRKAPKDSPLLTQVRQAHGTAKGPIFAASELGQYRLLEAFARLAAPAGRAGADSAEAIEKKTAAQPASFVKEPVTESPLPEADELRPLDSVAPPVVPGEGARKIEKQPKPRPFGQAAPLGGEAQGFTPRDPFDPEIFNRRYGTKPGA
jgi:hypothetical protein